MELFTFSTSVCVQSSCWCVQGSPAEHKRLTSRVISLTFWVHAAASIMYFYLSSGCRGTHILLQLKVKIYEASMCRISLLQLVTSIWFSTVVLKRKDKKQSIYFYYYFCFLCERLMSLVKLQTTPCFIVSIHKPKNYTTAALTFDNVLFWWVHHIFLNLNY